MLRIYSHTQTHTHKAKKEADRSNFGSLMAPPAVLSYAVRANRTHMKNTQHVFISEKHFEITHTHTHTRSESSPSAAFTFPSRATSHF